jgi:multimeric flavodoxin WrbA
VRSTPKPSHVQILIISFKPVKFGEKVVRLLGIVGSPRKGGNTEIAIKEALKAGVQEGAETELVHLVDFKLEACDACRICFETKNCVIDDDVEDIFDKMVQADGIIVGSPVYFQNVNAQTKIFIDRVGYLNIARERKPFRNKIGGAIAVARRSGFANALSEILLFLTGARMIAAGPSVTVLAREKGDAIKDAEGVELARELGKSIVQIAKATASLRGA